MGKISAEPGKLPGFFYANKLKCIRKKGGGCYKNVYKILNKPS